MGTKRESTGLFFNRFILITQSNHIITLIMAKIGYIMATAHYEKLEADPESMQEYGCVKVIEENDADEKNRPL